MLGQHWCGHTRLPSAPLAQPSDERHPHLLVRLQRDTVRSELGGGSRAQHDADGALHHLALLLSPVGRSESRSRGQHARLTSSRSSRTRQALSRNHGVHRCPLVWHGAPHVGAHPHPHRDRLTPSAVRWARRHAIAPPIAVGRAEKANCGVGWRATRALATPHPTIPHRWKRCCPACPTTRIGYVAATQSGHGGWGSHVARGVSLLPTVATPATWNGV